MKYSRVFVLLTLVLLPLGPGLRGGPTEGAIVAAMKLPAAKSYSWVPTVEDDARTYDLSDQTDFSLVTMPMVGALRRRSVRGRAESDNQVEAVFQGAEKCVVNAPEGWQTPVEIIAKARSVQRSGGLPGGSYPASGSPIGGFPAGLPVAAEASLPIPPPTAIFR